MRVALLTREYPPEVYGGAGVHVEYLARELRSVVDLDVHCWGAERSEDGVHAYRAWDALAGKAPHLAALQAVSVDLLMTAGLYSNVIRVLVPLVATALDLDEGLDILERSLLEAADA